MPVFDTTPPGMGGRLKPRCARHGNFTPPRIAPSCPQAGISLCTDEVMAKTACPLFLDGWVPLTALFGRLLWGIPTGGSWRTLQSRFAPFGRIVRERISVAGCDRTWSGVFQGAPGARKAPSLCRQREGPFYKLISKNFLFFSTAEKLRTGSSPIFRPARSDHALQSQ